MQRPKATRIKPELLREEDTDYEGDEYDRLAATILDESVSVSDLALWESANLQESIASALRQNIEPYRSALWRIMQAREAHTDRYAREVLREPAEIAAKAFTRQSDD